MQDVALAKIVALGAVIGALMGLLYDNSGTGLLTGFVIGVLVSFAWAWPRDFSR